MNTILLMRGSFGSHILSGDPWKMSCTPCKWEKHVNISGTGMCTAHSCQLEKSQEKAHKRILQTAKSLSGGTLANKNKSIALDQQSNLRKVSDKPTNI
jgi:hypothetical protein